MEADHLVQRAQAAGFDLSPAEIALLQALGRTGSFDGLAWQSPADQAAISGAAAFHLPSVWTDELESVTPSLVVIEAEPTAASGAAGDARTATEPVSTARESRYLTHHEQLYAEVPFPTISATLFTWLLSSEAGGQLPRVSMQHVKIAGWVSATDCRTSSEIELYACIFEQSLELSGVFRRRLYLATVLADSLSADTSTRA